MQVKKEKVPETPVSSSRAVGALLPTPPGWSFSGELVYRLSSHLTQLGAAFAFISPRRNFF